MTTDEHASLVEAASRGDGVAIDALVDRNLARLRAFVRLHMNADLRRREESCDIVQSVCRELIEEVDRFDYRGEERFRAWLFTAALNKIREKGRFHHRGKRNLGREQRPSGDASDDLLASYATVATPSRAVAAAEEIDRIEASLDRLPADYRQVIALARIAGLPHEEVARSLGRTVGAVRQLLGRALIALGRELEAERA